MSADDPPEDGPPSRRRRRLLALLALAGLGGTGLAGAWYATGRDEPPALRWRDTPTPPPPDEPPAVVRQYAPDLYFGALEQWFPTDPRPYVVETADGPVVDGFTALEAYSKAFSGSGRPPNPTVFYHVTEAAPGVDAVQYWLYSVFDQFSVNFHWHDWELLQVFVDRDSGRPRLLSASAHARKVPNNEFLDPPDARPGLLAEVGSHSSASELNAVAPSFERLPIADTPADVTNGGVDVSSALSTSFAYGLPRDEGARLPFVLPELDGVPLDEHPSLDVTREDLIDASVTVGAWHGLPRPPTALPTRRPGLVMGPPGSTTPVDATYQLLPIELAAAAITDFVGPQLRFEFAIPGFVEDALASHLTSVGIPWEQPRFTDPLADVTDPRHRERLAGSAPPSLHDRVVGRVRQLGSGAGGALGNVSDEAREALEDVATVSLFGLPVEPVVQLASEDPVASPTRAGVFGFLHVEPGEHRLVVDGPGYAPLAFRFVHGGGLAQVGAAGELTVVANADAGWIRGDGRPANGISHVRIVEAYAGVVFDGRPVEPDRFAVAVHRDGTYTVEVVDRGGRPGAFLVGPNDFGDTGAVVRDRLETGKASLARAVRYRLVELSDLAERLSAPLETTGEVLDQLSLAVEHAAAAADAAAQEDARRSNDQLSRAIEALRSALEVLLGDRRGGYSDAAAAALVPRLRDAIERADLAIETSL